MAGTILITGANGSLSLSLVQELLTKEPQCTLLLTVRNASNTDANTEKLRHIVSRFDKGRVSIRELDLGDLTAVHSFIKSVAAEVSGKELPPLISIICNAYYWNLKGAPEMTQDGFEKTFQVNHISHAALVLGLLPSFESTNNSGRVVLFSSDAHWPKNNSLEKYPPAIPDDVELLAKPATGPSTDFSSTDYLGKGFQRYANSKLAITMWMYALNRHLQKNLETSITAVAMNPGNLSDSRALRTNTPPLLFYMSKFVIQPFRFLLKFSDPTMRTASEAAVDVAALSTSKAHAGQGGFFTLLKKENSSPDSQDEKKQDLLWNKTLEWTRMEAEGI